jgi:hypothetical protein
MDATERSARSFVERALSRSIYRTRFDRPNDDDVTQSARGRDMRKPLRPPAVTQDPSLAWSLLRKGKPVNYMLPMSIVWLRTLPRDVRPMALVKQKLHECQPVTTSDRACIRSNSGGLQPI